MMMSLLVLPILHETIYNVLSEFSFFDGKQAILSVQINILPKDRQKVIYI